MWQQLSLLQLVESYKILAYPFILLLILYWLPMPLFMLFGRWRRW